MSTSIVLVIIALILTVYNAATNKLPLWIPVLILCLAMLLPGLILVRG